MAIVVGPKYSSIYSHKNGKFRLRFLSGLAIEQVHNDIPEKRNFG